MKKMSFRFLRKIIKPEKDSPKVAPAWQHWEELDDASLGKEVKRLGRLLITRSADGEQTSDRGGLLLENLMTKTATVGMCCHLSSAKINEAIFNIEGIIDSNGKSFGDWEICYRRREKQ